MNSIKLKPNILFVLIDSFRADRFHGENKKAETRTFDKLANDGLYFSNAISSSDYTGPVLKSIFTSRFPYGCGTSKENYEKFYSKNLSYLSILKENGYHTYGYMEKAICDQGFEEPYENHDVAFKSTENVHNGLGEKILKKLESMQEPWFYYLHFMDLHKPCAVPEEFKELSLSERYDYNISSIDLLIGKILNKLKSDKTITIITADHGEYISPYDNYMGIQDKSSTATKKIKDSIKNIIPKSLHTPIHVKKKEILSSIRSTKMKSSHEKRMLKTRPMKDRMFFDDVVHVPLIISGYGVQKTPIIKTQVGTIDIFPTIFEILVLTPPNPNVDGRSLVPFMSGKILNPIPIYMESSVIRTATKDPKPVVGIRTGDYKYFRDLHDPNKNVNLYDLQADPLEDNNIANENPLKVEELEKILINLQENAHNEPESEKLSAEEEKELEAELKKLGYL